MYNPKILPYKGILPKISNKAFISHDAVITGDTTIEANVNIWFGCVIRGDVESVHIGEGTNVQDGTIIHVSRANHPNNKSGEQGGKTIIGQGVTIGHQCTIHACTIHDYAFIGMHSLILDGAIIEPRAMVAAGAVVPPKKVLESGYIYCGNPAKKMRALTPTEQDYFVQSRENYIQLAQEYFPYFEDSNI